MSIFNENYSKYLTETKSEAKQDLRNRTVYSYIKPYRSGSKKYFYNGSYDDLDKEKKAVNKPMRTAEDYKRREKFYSDSNKFNHKKKKILLKKRKFAKRPILGAIERKINRKIDEDDRKRNDNTVRTTGRHYYDDSYFSSARKRKNLKEACEYILSILDESEYIDDDYDFEDID